MSWVSSPDISGWLSSEYAGAGILGSNISAVGDNGGSPAINDGISSTAEYRWQLVSGPSNGTLKLFEDLHFEFTGAPDGSYTFVYRLFENNIQQYPDATVYLQVGAISCSIGATLANAQGSISTQSSAVCSIFASTSISADIDSQVLIAPFINDIVAVTDAILCGLHTVSRPKCTIGATTTLSAALTTQVINMATQLRPEDIAAIANAVVARLEAMMLNVNVKEINGIAITGIGTAESPWGPA